jgi:hypothetical protein
MALKAITSTDHIRLLKQLQKLPIDQWEKCEVLLRQFYEEYNTLIVNLADVIEKYREVAAKINERQPLVKRKEPQ